MLGRNLLASVYRCGRSELRRQRRRSVYEKSEGFSIQRGKER